jgi:TRAP-type C4-dicarboxylate transport system substrate-binding protein
MRHIVTLGATALAAVLTVSTASAQQEINITVAAGQATRAMKPLAMVGETFIPDVDRRIKAAGLNIKINWKEAYAGSLLKPTFVLEGVRDGIADIGFEPTIFHPDKLPLEQVSFATPFTTIDVGLVGRVMNALHANVPEYSAQYTKFNTVRLGGSSFDSYEMFSTFPLKKFEDVKGRKIATAGAALQWIRGSGATPVSSNMMEYYNSAKTGVIEGFIIFHSAIPGMKYPEAAPYVTRIGFGAMYAAALIVNKQTFEKYPPTLQKILREAGEAWGTAADKEMLNAGDTSFAMVKDYPKAEAFTLPRDEQVKWANAMPNVAKEWAARLDQQGLPGQKILAGYMDEMRKAGAKPVRDWEK